MKSHALIGRLAYGDASDVNHAKGKQVTDMLPDLAIVTSHALCDFDAILV